MNNRIEQISSAQSHANESPLSISKRRIQAIEVNKNSYLAEDESLNSSSAAAGFANNLMYLPLTPKVQTYEEEEMKTIITDEVATSFSVSQPSSKMEGSTPNPAKTPRRRVIKKIS